MSQPAVTGNKHVIDGVHFAKMKDGAIVWYIIAALLSSSKAALLASPFAFVIVSLGATSRASG